MIRSLPFAIVLSACPSGDDDPTMSTAADCDVASSVWVADLGAPTVALAATAGHVVYATRVDLFSPTELFAVPHGGGAPVLLHTSPVGWAIESLAGTSDDVLFLEAEDGLPGSDLYRIPAGGGSPDLIATDLPTGRLAGSDGASAFVSTQDAFLRVDLATGAEATVANTAALGTSTQLRLSEGELFFVGAEDPDFGLSSAAFSVPADATDAVPELRISGLEFPECGFPLGGLAATPTQLACGFDEVAVFDRADGTLLDVIVTGGLESFGHVVVGSAGDRLFLGEVGDGTADRRMFRVQTDGGGFQPIACDVGKVAWQTADGFFPISTEYQLVVVGDTAVWVDERWPAGATGPSVSLRAAE